MCIVYNQQVEKRLVYYFSPAKSQKKSNIEWFLCDLLNAKTGGFTYFLLKFYFLAYFST